MKHNVELLKIVFTSVAAILLAMFVFRACQMGERGSASTNREPVVLPEELRKGPPSKANRPYLTGAFRRHFKKHRATLDKIVAMALEEEGGMRLGWRCDFGGLSVERQNTYLTLLRELESSEWISVRPHPFRVKVVMYAHGISISGMMRGYLYSPDKEPSPPVFVNDLDVGMKEHPDGWHIVYVPLEDGWYIFCDWEL